MVAKDEIEILKVSMQNYYELKAELSNECMANTTAGLPQTKAKTVIKKSPIEFSAKR